MVINCLYSPPFYRKMLFDVAENMTSEKLSSFKFLVNLPRGKLEASAVS